jgi:hypothetical protein
MINDFNVHSVWKYANGGSYTRPNKYDLMISQKKYKAKQDIIWGFLPNTNGQPNILFKKGDEIVGQQVEKFIFNQIMKGILAKPTVSTARVETSDGLAFVPFSQIDIIVDNSPGTRGTRGQVTTATSSGTGQSYNPKNDPYLNSYEVLEDFIGTEEFIGDYPNRRPLKDYQFKKGDIIFVRETRDFALNPLLTASKIYDPINDKFISLNNSYEVDGRFLTKKVWEAPSHSTAIEMPKFSKIDFKNPFSEGYKKYVVTEDFTSKNLDGRTKNFKVGMNLYAKEMTSGSGSPFSIGGDIRPKVMWSGLVSYAGFEILQDKVKEKGLNVLEGIQKFFAKKSNRNFA